MGFLEGFKPDIYYKGIFYVSGFALVSSIAFADKLENLIFIQKVAFSFLILSCALWAIDWIFTTALDYQERKFNRNEDTIEGLLVFRILLSLFVFIVGTFTIWALT